MHPYLRPWQGASSTPGSRILGRPGPGRSIDDLASRFARFGYRFVPLVTRDLELLCNIEILFLRQGSPGEIINRTGDIDNRLKTLFLCRAIAVKWGNTSDRVEKKIRFLSFSRMTLL
jgi:hypothetical protein